MSTMPDSEWFVIAGVDTHRDFHVAAACDRLGGVLGTASFPTSPGGYRRLVEWLRSFGTLKTVGVEGTGSYGAGLARFLASRDVEVVEVIRPNRQHRRRWGKSDPADAVAAARAVISGEARGVPRGDGPTEGLRVLRVARSSAVRQRSAVANQIHALVVTAPEDLRHKLQGLSVSGITRIACRWRPGDPLDTTQATRLALRTLARRWQALGGEIDTLGGHIRRIVEQISPPGLLHTVGIGPIIAADLLITAGNNPDRITSPGSFVALCGVSPVDASSGLQQRHRLNRGGDRQANAALHRAVVVRLRYHQPTRDYLTRRLADGKTRKEAIRCLKWYLARHIQRTLKPAT
jgi:transposase